MTKRSGLSDTFRCFLSLALSLIVINVINAGPARAQSEMQPRTTAQLEQLVAPIALYPDTLLSQVLMASTYPLEVVADGTCATIGSDCNSKPTGNGSHRAR
jgi:hypothetical protein